jgi:ATP-binding cassette subfamily F protein 3
MRIALAKALLTNPDFLLLDEPVNYLDIDAKNWLADFIDRFQGGIILVAHDRNFLDKTTVETIEVFNGEIKKYPCTFSKYESIREQEIIELKQKYREQQEYIEKSEQFIERFRAKATKAAAVQSKIRELEKIQRIEIPDNFKTINIKFPQPSESGKEVLTVENIYKSYGSKKILENVNFNIIRGEKIAVTGINGAGKTTLLRIIADNLKSDSGTIKFGTNVTPGYFAQEHEDLLPQKSTVLEYIEDNCATEKIPYIRDMLGAFLFHGDDVFKNCGVLSGGEKNRLYLLKVLLQENNFLILDEPTNHLDIHSKDVLLKALQQYTGTVIFVSHDLYFLEHLAEKVIEVSDKGASIYPGDYNYYQWKKENPTETAIYQNEEITEINNDSEKNSGRVSHEEYKKLKNKARKLEKEEELLLTKAQEIEALIEENEKLLHLPEYYTDHKKSAEISSKIDELSAELNSTQQKWEETLIELESIKDQL